MCDIMIAHIEDAVKQKQEFCGFVGRAIAMQAIDTQRYLSKKKVPYEKNKTDCNLGGAVGSAYLLQGQLVWQNG